MTEEIACSFRNREDEPCPLPAETKLWCVAKGSAYACRFHVDFAAKAMAQFGSVLVIKLAKE